MDETAVVEALSSEVARRVPAWYGPGAVAQRPPALVRRRFSFFFRFPVVNAEGRTIHVLVKVPRYPETTELTVAATEPRSTAAIREYETLVAIHQWASTEGNGSFGAVRPLGFLEPWNAFAMEEVAGPSLKRMVGRWPVLAGGRAAWIDLERVYHRVGSWLAAFHDRLGGARESSPDKAELRDTTAAALDNLERASARRLETASLREALFARIDSLSAPLDRVAVLHGDFMSHNVLVAADDRIVVLDTRRTVSGSVYQDIARLATDVSTLPAQVLTHGAAYRERRVRRCVDALLLGYFRDRGHDAQLLAIHSGLAVLGKWAFDEERLAGCRLPRPVKAALTEWTRGFLRRRFHERLSR